MPAVVYETVEDVVAWVRAALAGESEATTAFIALETGEPVHRRTTRLVADIWCIRLGQLGEQHGPFSPCDRCWTTALEALREPRVRAAAEVEAARWRR